MVRPRFQRDPPPFPEIGEDWCAFAVKSIIPDDGPYFDQKDETIDSIRHEELTLFLSFYGDHSQSIANVLKDGLGIPQNIAQLKAQKSNLSRWVRSSPRLTFSIISMYIDMT